MIRTRSGLIRNRTRSGLVQGTRNIAVPSQRKPGQGRNLGTEVMRWGVGGMSVCARPWVHPGTRNSPEYLAVVPQIKI